MPFCPDCKTEYVEGIRECSDCGTGLVEELPSPGQEAPALEQGKKVFLTAVGNDIEGDIIQSLLDSYGIPIVKQYPGAGGYLKVYTGAANQRINIFVSEESLEEAREIISTGNIDYQDMPREDWEETREMEAEYIRKRQNRAWIILLVFAPGILYFAVSVIIRIVKYLMKLGY